MSRIEEAFDELRDAGLPLNEFATTLAQLIRTTQQQTRCTVTVEADYEHRVNKNPSGKTSGELLKFFAEATHSDQGLEIRNGITVPFINACPCTQRWGMRQFFNTLRQKGYDTKTAEDLTRCAPLQAHTNRGTAKLIISSQSATHQALYQTLDQAVPIIRELLKGQDEHALVSLAHNAGQFCEDNTRAIIKAVNDNFASILEPDDFVEIAVEVDESVHFHNLSASFSGKIAEIRQLLDYQSS